MKLRQVDLTVGSFTGPLLVTDTGQYLRSEGRTAFRKMCDVCGNERAMWQHHLKKKPKETVFLCFGCGGH